MSRLAKMTTTASGLVIGRSFIPRPPDIGSEAERLQAALLHTQPPLSERLLDAFNDNATAVMVAIFIGGLALGIAKRFA